MIQIKAKQQNVSFEKNVEKLAFVLSAHLYNTLAADKVIEEAAKRSGISVGVIKAAWDAAGEVIRTWATEGHNVPLPGLGSMRFSVRSKSVQNVEDVKTSLITARRVIFTPSKEVKDELQDTKIAITCYDKDGNIVKRVTSADTNDVEDNENENENQNENQGGNSGGSGNSGSSVPTLTISKTGSGSSAVTVGGNAVNSGSQIAAGTEVALSVTPAAGQTPNATLNGSSVSLTESDGTYTGTFQMPDGNATLVINSGSTGGGGVDQN
ncbi:MAG: hypothetical protein IKN15_10165 [Bacteroidaceae bacterium]|nr:hypothetical protein [Bacteroidaceae bacterium]